MIETSEVYTWEDGYTMKREYGRTPNGNAIRGMWVLRDKYGKFIDYDQYRNDLVKIHGRTIIGSTWERKPLTEHS